MKKLIAALAVLASGAAVAAGPSDGVYVNLSAPNSYLSVHTNGDRIIATVYGIIQASGIRIYSALGNVDPTQLNTWDLLQGYGRTDGSLFYVNGQMFYNACTVDITLRFSAGAATAQVNSAVQTVVGRNSGVNCAALPSLFPNGIAFTKAF